MLKNLVRECGYKSISQASDILDISVYDMQKEYKGNKQWLKNVLMMKSTEIKNNGSVESRVKNIIYFKPLSIAVIKNRLRSEKPSVIDNAINALLENNEIVECSSYKKPSGRPTSIKYKAVS